MILDDYNDKAIEFRHLVEIGQEYDEPLDALHGHFNVADEEWRELCESEMEMEQHLVDDADIYNDVPDEVMADMAEEMADVLVTLHVMADMIGIELKEAYNLKMGYNLEKTASKNSNGKVTDDAELSKPDFTQAIGDR